MLHFSSLLKGVLLNLQLSLAVCYKCLWACVSRLPCTPLQLLQRFHESWADSQQICPDYPSTNQINICWVVILLSCLTMIDGHDDTCLHSWTFETYTCHNATVLPLLETRLTRASCRRLSNLVTGTTPTQELWGCLGPLSRLPRAPAPEWVGG